MNTAMMMASASSSPTPSSPALSRARFAVFKRTWSLSRVRGSWLDAYFGAAEVIELGRALNQWPPRLIVYGIEGKNFAPRTGLSEAVEKAVPEVIARIV